jgi:hypothetical protein
MIQRRKGKTGLAVPTSMVAMAPARALTSHVRRHYHERYKGRYRFAGAVFGFDVFLLGVAAALLVLDLVLFLGGGQMLNGGIALDLTTSPLRASDLVPVEAVLRATDGRTHTDVSLRWQLPEWVEVVSSSPAIPPTGAIWFGTLRPGDTVSSHLVLRIRAERGTSVPFAFQIHQFDPLGLTSELSGKEPRVMTEAALTAIPAVTSTHVTSDASVPLLVSNVSKTTAKAVVLRLTESDGAPEAQLGSEGVQLIGDLAPGERRLAYVDLGTVSSSSVSLGWQLQDGAQVVDDERATYLVTTSTPPKLAVTVASDHVSVVPPTSGTWRMLLDQPRDLVASPHVISFLAGSPTVSVPLNSSRTDSSCSYVLIDDSVSGGVLTGRQQVGSSLPSAVAIRYFAASGDQIGVGPLPPAVGQATTYWVVWTLGPSAEDFSNLKLSAALSPGVTATGKFASAVEGAFSEQGQNITWDVPSLPATSGAELPTFAFEISFTPTATDSGKLAYLIQAAHLEATSLQSGVTTTSDVASLTTDLVSDPKAAGKGIVQP